MVWKTIKNQYRKINFMNINKKIDRKLCHTREVFSQGYRRIDGLYDIESVLTDTKSYSFQKFDGRFFLFNKKL